MKKISSLVLLMTATILTFTACSKNTASNDIPNAPKNNLNGTRWARGVPQSFTEHTSPNETVYYDTSDSQIIEFLSATDFRTYMENEKEELKGKIKSGTYSYVNEIVRFKSEEVNFTYAEIDRDIMTVNGELMFKRKR